MRLVNKDGSSQEEEPEVSLLFFGDPTLVHFIGMLIPPRPGVSDCFNALEHTHYTPGTPENDRLTVRILEWHEIMWSIVSIPLADKQRMERAARAHGLRLAEGAPTIINDGSVDHFPVSNDRTYTLENTPNHPVYTRQKKTED